MEFLINVLQPCVSKVFVDNVRCKTSYVQQFITGTKFDSRKPGGKSLVKNLQSSCNSLCGCRTEFK